MTDWPTFLDPFVIDFRDDPTAENRDRLMRAQAVQARQFLRTQTVEFVARTKAPAAATEDPEAPRGTQDTDADR